MRKNPWLFFTLLITGFVAALVILPFVGIDLITPAQVFTAEENQIQHIFWELRVPRVLTGMLVGSVLAMAGMTFQALFRNALATPFTLGTASGASLGASVYIWAGWSISLLGISGQTLFAFLGAITALAFVYGFSRVKNGMSTNTMLLAGVAIGIFFSSLILLIQYMADQAHSLRILRWLMGGLEVVGFRQFLEVLPFMLLGAVVIYFYRWEMNLISTGEDLAAGRGVNVNRTKIVLLVTAGLMVGAVVAVAGPIGFVGLIVPHICRLLIGPDHRRLEIACVLLGGIFLSVCDALARLLIAPSELPVGIVTALLGGPFFLWVLLRKKIS